MKKRFLLLTLIMCLFGGVKSSLLNAQDVVTIDGNGINSSQYGDQGLFETYKTSTSSSQSIYTKEEIGISAGSTITHLAFKIDATENTSRTIVVWLKNINEVDFGENNNQGLIQMSDEYKVFEGIFDLSQSGWNSIDLDDDFVYTGASLLVTVYDETGEAGAGTVKFNMFDSYKSEGNNYWYRTLFKKDANPATETLLNGKRNTPSLQLTFAGGIPETPTDLSPEDGTTGVINPTLQFTLSNNTTQYQILLNQNEDLVANEDPVAVVKDWTDGNGEVSYETSGLGLDAGATYYWKVIAKNDAGEAASDVYSFTTLAPPTAPTLKSPTNKATGLINPTLQFTLSDNTTQYQILLDKNTTPTTVVKEGTYYNNGNVSYQTSGLDTDATYYWKVIAMNGAGEAESGTYQFTTANIFPVTEYEIKLDENNITLEWQYADQNANEYQVCFGGIEQGIIEWQYSDWKPRGTEAETLVEDGFFTIENADFGDKVYFRVDVREKEGETVLYDATGATAFCVILDKDTDWGDSDSYNNADYVFVRADVRVINNITAKNITIENGGILRTIMNNVVVSANTLVVNEGGQFFATDKLTNFPINTVKFNKKIANPVGEWDGANNKTGWQFISSPFKDAPISSFIPGQGDYDLYKYDGSAEKQWVNYKDSELAESFAQGGIFAQGIGYLASYETKDTLTFTRTFNSINRTNTLNIGSDGMMETQGIYLLGNPFLFNMDWETISASSDGGTNGAYGINATSFVVVKADGAYQYKTSGEIKVGEGFFVLTTEDWASFNYTFTANDIVAAPSSKSRNSQQSKSLNIIATGNAGNDNVVVNFNGEGEGFPKLQNFNDDIATVYVQNNDANYGVYNCDENTTEVELCFNANQMGNYTISVEPTGEFSSIVLVDRFTGIETNLLVEDYRFTAMSEENNNRFIVKLAVSDQQSANSNFVYQSGEELIVEAEGTVQIIDMMGRVVYTSNVENNNRIDVSDFNNGAYVVRVINENEVKVQKIIL